MSLSIGTCPDCQRRDMSIKGRGRCAACYKRLRAKETHGRVAPPRVDRVRQVVETFQRGITSVPDIARSLGVSHDTVQSALARARRAGVLPSAKPESHWDRPIPLAPTAPPCAGQTMDFDGLQRSELHPVRNTVVEDALALCATCPLATRQWCLAVMDPQGAGKEWQGVAGGAVWSHGRLVYMPVEEFAS